MMYDEEHFTPPADLKYVVTFLLNSSSSTVQWNCTIGMLRSQRVYNFREVIVPGKIFSYQLIYKNTKNNNMILYQNSKTLAF